jgi:hypothetical protein
MVALAALLLFFLGDFYIPHRPPHIDRTFNPSIQPAPLEFGSYDVLGRLVSREEAQELLQTEEGREMLSRSAGAIEITEELVELGRTEFYLETFGNEVFLTDIVGIMDGPINFGSISRAILGLGGRHTNNLQVRLDQDMIIGGREFAAGTLLNTGLDVPPRSLLPVGIRVRVTRGRIRAGVTCAMCHVTVEPDTGRLIEGATNIDIDTGLIIAMATNSAAFFRHTDADPVGMPQGMARYIDSEGAEALLPDPVAMEDAVDAALLAWPPAMFDTTPDLVNNPTFIPSSFTFGQWPYGWNGFASLGWFQGLTTLNNNVHAVSADASSDSASAPELLGIDEETYLGILLQNAAHERFRLPEGARPSEFFQSVNPTPHTPGVAHLVTMPDYPRGSAFIPNAMLANSPGMPFAEELNAMSAYQHRLAPPPNRPTDDVAALERGAEVFGQAGCGDCHSGRFFSNNSVIPLSEIGTQPSRALAQADQAELFVEPQTWTPDMIAPVAPGAGALAVPTDVTPQELREQAYLLNGAEGGYKVITLIGIYLHAPYLHDGGVAAGPNALREQNGRYVVADADELGMAGTLLRGIRPDPAASLRVLLDRDLRQDMVAANRAHPDLQSTHVEGIGHEYWVDEEAGFTTQQQTDLILFLLSLDDDPEVLPWGP